MGNIINIIAFLILNATFLVFMFRYSARLKNPLNSSKFLLLEGPEMFLVILFATGTLALSSSGGGQGTGSGLNLQAIRLALLEALLVMSYFMASHKPTWGIGTISYLVYMIWLLYSMTYSGAGQYGWRYILKYIYPLLIMLSASAIVRDEEVFLAICVWTRRVAVCSLFVFFFPFVNRIIGGLFWYATALSIHYVIIICISLALYFFYGKDIKDLILAIIFVFPCIFMVHRTGLLATFGAIAVFCFYKYKWISLPYIAGVLAIGLGIVFYVPSFHNKMFWKDKENTLTVADLREGNISEEDIRNNGREAVWEMLKEEFYYGHELKGSGIGSCQKFLYANPTIVKQTHGDYVQMKCDTGDIGMGLYILIAVMVIVHCFIVNVKPSNPDYIKCCAIIVASSLVGNYFAMYSDNAVTYTMATTGYPFGFYGAMLGMLNKYKSTV